MKQRNNKNYKEILARRKMENRGQVTIFIIVAILIVVAGVIIYFIAPEQVSLLIGGKVNPNTFLGECIEPAIEENVEKLSNQGGYLNPEGFLLYGGNKIKYLCYTSEYYQPCLVQQPLLLGHFESELEKLVDERAKECIAELKDSYDSKGYVVAGGIDVETDVEVIPGKTRVVIKAPMTVTKDETQSFEKFTHDIPGSMYDLIMIATSIIDYESTYGDAAVDLYYDYYPNLIIEKNKLGDGSTLYVVRDVTTEDSFTFASRSIAWPGGYGLES
jgi:hypothetical protein